MAIENQSPGHAFTTKDAELAERRAAEARERAAQAGLSAARSIERSALQHERVARVQDRTIEQGASHEDLHREWAAKHRDAAVDDHKLAELKRKESEADLAVD
ncbi:hypothetical protein KXD96_21830 [Mycobacterium sp. SMC-2]|uniref:hypothetical protein n=1 Tax=Mycobacterium sp. SMC-2 TaxID=2857058 RepID=UPI0021B1EA3A|nr:hypothetical protein [Mycobacterium sp. SMC-2]UXA05539.1 hypothetical protein KXD96_21830 [Mycobacterium sp. SMC-2]